jgi:hypothetical protein
MVVLRISLGHTISERVNRAVLPVRRSLPIYPDKQTLGGGRHVSKVPKSDIDSITIRPLRWRGS